MRNLYALIALFSIASGRPGDDVLIKSHDGTHDSDDLEFSPGYDLTNDIVESPFRTASKDRDLRFPNGEVPYVLSDDFSADQINKIKNAMGIIEQYTRSDERNCISFHPKTNQDEYYIEFVLTTKGTSCESGVGIRSQGTKINLLESCFVAVTLIHELMHALGFFHEHSRIDRNNYVTVLTDSIATYRRSSYTIQWDSTNQSIPYDYGSVMHYVDRFIIPKYDAYLGGRRKLLNQKMSKYDVLRIQRFYSCKEYNKNYLKAIQKESSNVVFDCSFKKRLCNLTQLSSPWDSFDWERVKAPKGQRSYRGPYLIARAEGHKGQNAILKGPSIDKGRYLITLAYKGDSLNEGNTVRMFLKMSTHFNIASLLPQSIQHWTSTSRGFYLPQKWHLEIEATIGDNSNTSIAIDDVIIQKYPS